MSSGAQCVVGNNRISSGCIHPISCGCMGYLVGISCGQHRFIIISCGGVYLVGNRSPQDIQLVPHKIYTLLYLVGISCG